MDSPITNMDDLRAEIYRLRGLEQEQAIAIGSRFNSLPALFSTFMSLFPARTVNADGETSGGFLHQDIVGLISRFVLPFTLNKTIFRHSNFIVKALVGLVSQKASHFISEDSVVGVWDKAKSLFNKVTHAKPAHKKTPALHKTK